MCRIASAEFDAVPTSGSAARHFVSDLLGHWELAALIDDAELLTSELVTNAVGHASTELKLLVAVADGVLEIGVTDLDPSSLPLVRPRREHLHVMKDKFLAERGRGLLLVDQLSESWGVVGLPHGKLVWFGLGTQDWPYNSTCRCDPGEIDRVRLGSGRYAVALAGPWDN